MKNNGLPVILGLALMSFSAASVRAQSSGSELSYSYLETDLGVSKISAAQSDSLSSDRLNLGGSVRISDNFYITGRFSHTVGHLKSVFYRQKEASLRGGYRYGLTPRLDLTAELGFEEAHTTIGPVYGIDYVTVFYGGIRSLVLNDLELRAQIGSHQINGGGSYGSYHMGVSYHLNRTWAIKGDISTFKFDGLTTDGYSIGLLYKF